jgi:hypothetical protein
MIGMKMGAKHCLDSGRVEPVGLHATEKVGHAVQVTGIDEHRHLAVDENAVAVIFSRFAPQIEIEVVGNSHNYTTSSCSG